MCGIFGYTGVISPDKQEFFFSLLEALFYAAEARGTHASGFAARFASGEITTDKLPYRGSVFTAISPRFRQLAGKEQMPTSFIAHTRYGTGSSPLVLNNNHPFYGKDFVMVHNGTVHGWRELAKKYDIEKSFTSETDSELLIRIFDKFFVEGPEARPQDIIQTLLNDVWGNQAVALMRKSSSQIWLYRNENPLSVFIFDAGVLGPQQVHMFCSTWEIFSTAWKDSRFKEKLHKVANSSLLPENKAHVISTDPIAFGKDNKKTGNYIVYPTVVTRPFYKQSGYTSCSYDWAAYHPAKVTEAETKDFRSIIYDPMVPANGCFLSKEQITEIEGRRANKKLVTTIDGIDLPSHQLLATFINRLSFADLNEPVIV